MAPWLKLPFLKLLERKEGRKKGSFRTFSLKELHAATNSFNYDNKLGEGLFGSVYWGQLWDGSQIAVKRLKVWSDKTEAEFPTEIEILGKITHKNLLSLRGFCIEGQERLIVYDYVQNLSVLYHLHGPYATDCLLDWKRRMHIAVGSAEGIAYLHHNAHPHIIHRHIKSSNVLLTSEFQPKVVDFGFGKFLPEDTSHSATGAKSSLGYCAPEHTMHGEASKSRDVYSFGILLLELVSGRKPLSKTTPTETVLIADWALPLAQEGKFEAIADPKLDGKFDMSELRRVVLVALICCQREPEKRPTMLEVVSRLKGTSSEKLAFLENHELFKREAIPSREEIKDVGTSGVSLDARDIIQGEDTQVDIKQGEDTQVDIKQGEDTQVDIKQGEDTQVDIKQGGDTQVDIKQGGDTQVDIKQGEDTQVDIKQGEDTQVDIKQESETDPASASMVL